MKEARRERWLGPGGHWLDCLRALRPHHWSKNLLVFFPAVAAHEVLPATWLAAAGAFAAMSACASGAYLFNDLLDRPQDRLHPSKRLRPVAAGKTPLGAAACCAAGLAAGGLALAFLLSTALGVCALLYVAANVAYTLWLKRKLMLDILTLVSFYLLRVFAGGVATSISLSPWFLTFFAFIFFTLAISKRQKELRLPPGAAYGDNNNRPYLVQDLPVLAALGAASALTSVVVLALYIQNPAVTMLYARPETLWFACPLIAYWQGRLLLFAHRGAMDDDPVLFSLRDPVSWLTGLGLLATFAAAL